jgi:hypothetical protein
MTSDGHNLRLSRTTITHLSRYGMDEFLNYSAQLNELRGGPPRNESTAEIARWTILGLRMVLFGGALTFMWRVRHPKTG